MKAKELKDTVIVQVIDNKPYVTLTINGQTKDIELKEVTNYEQDYLKSKISRCLRDTILDTLDFNEIYKGIQTLINQYWNWQTCPFKNEDLSDLNKYRYRYEININDTVIPIYFEWEDLQTDRIQFRWKFDYKLEDVIAILLTPIVHDKLKEIRYTKLKATITCECAPEMNAVWDNFDN